MCLLQSIHGWEMVAPISWRYYRLGVEVRVRLKRTHKYHEKRSTLPWLASASRPLSRNMLASLCNLSMATTALLLCKFPAWPKLPNRSLRAYGLHNDFIGAQMKLQK
jgi:hypothetical protein